VIILLLSSLLKIPSSTERPSISRGVIVLSETP